MTPPALSIVIPCRNGRDVLPRMLESIQAQSLKDLEVVVVDDCSDISCAEVIEAFAGKGLAVSLVESGERLYTKNARLLGIEHARADIIAFADADDVLYGTHALERHVDMFRAEGADLLQFRCVELDQLGRYARPNHNMPKGERLVGRNIFHTYLCSSLFGVCLHLYARRNWLALLSEARSISVRRLEDLCLLLLYYPHAQTYIGSMEFGYGYMRDISRARNFLETATRVLACHTLLITIPARLRTLGEDETIVEQLRQRLMEVLRLQAGRACMAYAQAPEELSCLSDADIPIFMECVAESLSANAHKLRAVCETIVSPSDRGPS